MLCAAFVQVRINEMNAMLRRAGASLRQGQSAEVQPGGGGDVDDGQHTVVVGEILQAVRSRAGSRYVPLHPIGPVRSSSGTRAPALSASTTGGSGSRASLAAAAVTAHAVPAEPNVPAGTVANAVAAINLRSSTGATPRAGSAPKRGATAAAAPATMGGVAAVRVSLPAHVRAVRHATHGDSGSPGSADAPRILHHEVCHDDAGLTIHHTAHAGADARAEEAAAGVIYHAPHPCIDGRGDTSAGVVHHAARAGIDGSSGVVHHAARASIDGSSGVAHHAARAGIDGSSSAEPVGIICHTAHTGVADAPRELRQEVYVGDGLGEEHAGLYGDGDRSGSSLDAMGGAYARKECTASEIEAVQSEVVEQPAVHRRPGYSVYRGDSLARSRGGNHPPGSQVATGSRIPVIVLPGRGANSVTGTSGEQQLPPHVKRKGLGHRIKRKLAKMTEAVEETAR